MPPRCHACAPHIHTLAACLYLVLREGEFPKAAIQRPFLEPGSTIQPENTPPSWRVMQQQPNRDMVCANPGQNARITITGQHAHLPSASTRLASWPQHWLMGADAKVSKSLVTSKMTPLTPTNRGMPGIWPEAEGARNCEKPAIPRAHPNPLAHLHVGVERRGPFEEANPCLLLLWSPLKSITRHVDNNLTTSTWPPTTPTTELTRTLVPERHVRGGPGPTIRPLGTTDT